MRKIGDIDLNIGQAYLSEWTEGMAIRELIANAMDETTNGNIDIKEAPEGVWKITNIGNEIKPENFVIKEGGKSKKKGKIGKFGIGLKDAIGVLMIRGTGVRILTSEYEYVAEYRKKNKLINAKCLFINIYKNTREWLGTQVILEKCSDDSIKEAESHFLIYRDKYMVVDTTEYGDILFEDDENKNGTIYLNGIKIAYESTFLYSYNIKVEEEILKKGISRERCDLSREVYKDILKMIINCIKSEDVLRGYYKRLIKTRDGSLKGELVYTEAQLKTIRYTIQHNISIVVFPSVCKGNLITLYKELISRDAITVIKLLNSYYNRLQKVSDLIERNILADNYNDKYTKINIEDLDYTAKSYFDSICNFVKDNIPYSIISKVILVKENIYSYIQEETKIIIPTKALDYVRDSCLNILNIIEDSAPNGKNIKDEILKKYIGIEINQKVHS